MKYYLLLLFFLNCSISTANSKEIAPGACLETALTQQELNQCAGVGFDEADAELNRVYKLIRRIYAEEEIFLGKLKNAQLAWIKLRDADLDLQYPEENKRMAYGSVFPMCFALYKTQMTLERVAFLKQWLEGTENGDVCSGSPMSQWQLEEILRESKE